ncbi:LptF/LptG family permease [Rubrivirga sp.]|uniref:LptF/LptG family permease n=1 Tax=Rubrivirga sp. TaxID=1885344 RepID=UPI003C770CCE
MTRFDLHVLRRFLSATILLVALLASIFVTIDFSEYVDDFLDRGATTGQIFGGYYLYYLADIVRQVSPLALFLAAVYVTARLAQSMQLTAIHMAGVSTWRFMRPFVLTGVVATTGMIAFNGWVVPRSQAVVHTFQNQYYRDAPEGGGDSEIVRQAAPGVVVSARYFDRDQQQAFRVSLITFDDSTESVTERLDASQMQWMDSLSVWRAQDVTIRRFAADGREQFERHASLDTALSLLPRDLAQSERDVERLTLPEAGAYVSSLERAGVAMRGRPTVAFHSKVAYPFANIILVVLAVPLAARRRRGGQAVHLALGLGVAFLYLALQKTIEPLGYVDTLPPVVAAWLPHVLFAIVATAMVITSNRRVA